MQPKKNPQSDLRNYSSLLFAFGLCIVLLVSWRAIEAKTYETKYGYESLNVDDDDDEEIPITEQLKTPPPAPEIIEIVEDEDEIEETIIESTVPLFPGCKRVAKSKRRDCFQEKMNNHIRRNFRYPEKAQEMRIQGRVFVQFMIGTDGDISGIRTRGPHSILEREANRIISLLPKMTPGTQKGRPVRVPFSIPIQFILR